MRDETSGGSNDDVGAQRQALQFLVVACAVVAAIDGYAAHAVEIVAETLHCLVYLLCQLARWSHDDAVHRVFLVAAVVEHTQYRQQISGCFAGSGLSYAQNVVAFQYLRNTLILNRSAGFKVHVI